jgi:prepilin-type N-terminal cleavage/methylation domain-containing protein
MKRRQGFTLTELIVVLAVIAIAAAVAIPKLLLARLSANEISAGETIALIGRAQMQFRASKKADLDNDGHGEFGYLKELSAAVGVRADADGSVVGSVISPPALSSTFRTLDPHGQYARSGYLYRIFLPDARGGGVAETEIYPVDGMVDPGLAAKSFSCYAWPTRHATSGNRTFFINEIGTVTETDSPKYTGVCSLGGANCGAALIEGTGPLTSIVGAPAFGATGRDDAVWSKTR